MLRCRLPSSRISGKSSESLRTRLAYNPFAPAARNARVRRSRRREERLRGPRTAALRTRLLFLRWARATLRLAEDTRRPRSARRAAGGSMPGPRRVPPRRWPGTPSSPAGDSVQDVQTRRLRRRFPRAAPMKMECVQNDLTDLPPLLTCPSTSMTSFVAKASHTTRTK